MGSYKKQVLTQLRTKKRAAAYLKSRITVPAPKAKRTFCNEDRKVVKFREWCVSEGISLSDKLYIGRDKSCHEIGVIATKTIQSGEVMAVIPRTATLTASSSKAASLMIQDHALLEVINEGGNPWIPLLIALTYEYAQEGQSKWQPYLDLVPNNEDCPPPMLWDKEERERFLRGTGVDRLVSSDLQRITEDFRTVVRPFLKRHSSLISKKFHSKEMFKSLVSFVMSYSFTDTRGDDPLSSTMMVPFVDLLNHHYNHNAELSYHSKYLKLVAIKDILKGEEVFNTFGDLPNYSLLHTYGFAIPDNTHDKVYIPIDIVKERYITFTDRPKDYQKRWTTMNRKDILLESYDIDNDGVPEIELKKLLILLFCDLTNFRRFCVSYDDWDVESHLLGQTETIFLQYIVVEVLSHVQPLSCKSLLNHDVLGDRQKAAITVSIGQINCLVKCLQWIHLSTRLAIK